MIFPDPATVSIIIEYLTVAIANLPRVVKGINSIFLVEAENKLQKPSASQNFRQAEQKYYKRKLELDQELIQLQKKKLSADKNNEIQRNKLQQIELELKAEISARRFELLKEFQRENVELKWTDIKFDWDGKNNWFSKINRVETEQILTKYYDCLLILTSPPKIAIDSSLDPFRYLDFELKMRDLEEFIEKTYPHKDVSHPVKYFSNYFKEPIGKIEVEQLYNILNRFSTYVIYPDITDKTVSFRVAYWSINGQLDFFSDSFKWNWKETQNYLLSEGQSEAESISTIRDMFVSFYKILAAFWIDYYYLSIDPFYNPKISSLKNEPELNFLSLYGQICETFKELQNQQYNQYLDYLQTTEENMESKNENQQATEILKNLQRLFSDRPEVLRLLEPTNLDPDRIAGEVILENYRNQEGFASPVNLYVTGRTRAGKTSLGNTIFDGKQTAMKSTGRRDCTDDVGCFQSANNLRYFDLPGAGSKEDFENINRSALCIEQIKSRRGKNPIVSQFILSDYTNYEKTKKSKQETISVEKWQSKDNQLIFGADVILYVIAPHEGLGRDDENYLYDLLSAQKEKRGSSNVVFALNLHLTENGEPKYTRANLEDAHKIITDIYYDIYPNHNTEPVIIEINSLTGIGADKIAEEICKLLPADKLGKMEEVLGDKLKEKARKERSKKFREALIYIASRLATFKVDQSFDGNNDIVIGAYAAVYSYSSKVFRKEVSSGENTYGVVADFADKTTKSRTQNETVSIPIIESIESFRTEIIPKFEKVEKETPFKVRDPKVVKVDRGWWNNFWQGTEEIVPSEKIEIYRSEEIQQVGVEKKKVSDGLRMQVTGYEDKVVGLKYLKGGYDLIKCIFSIGLGVENLADKNFDSFNRIYEVGEKEVNLKISNLKSRIEQVINNSDSKKAENEIIDILKKALL